VFDYLDAPVLRIGAAFAPIAHAPVLMGAAIPGVEEIVAGVAASFEHWATTPEDEE